MIDFPLPRIVGLTPDEKIAEIINYLIQFNESLEFTLMNISTDNLSPELINKLNELGASIDKSNAFREEEVAQISSKNITISDVCNSELFKICVKNEIEKYITNNDSL